MSTTAIAANVQDQIAEMNACRSEIEAFFLELEGKYGYDVLFSASQQAATFGRTTKPESRKSREQLMEL